MKSNFYRKMMIFTSLCLVLFSIQQIAVAQLQNTNSRGIYESYAILSINGGANTFYDLNSTTANPDFNGANLGNFCNSASIVVKGGENKTYKNSDCNITNGDLFYRVWTGSAAGSYTQINLPFGLDLGGGNQSWQGVSGTTNILTGLAAGTYTIEIYTRAQFNGCGTGEMFTNNNNPSTNYRATFTVLAPPAITNITGSVSNTSICAGSTQTLTANGVAGAGAVVTWWTATGGTGANLGTGSSLTNRGPGTYFARVTGTCSPAVESSIVIGSIALPATPTLSVTQLAPCVGTTGSITVSAPTGDGFTYNLNGGPFQSDPTFGSLAPGAYSIIAKSALGCVSAVAANATINPLISCLAGDITGATTVACFADFTVTLTAVPSGGTAPYTYLWSTGQSGAVINGAGAGIYSVTITDANGQTKVVEHTITQPAAVGATLDITNQKCLNPGTIVATGAGGTGAYEYALNFGAWQNSGTFNSLAPGKYFINIKDANGCQGKVSALITQQVSRMTLTAVRTGVSTCGATNGSITATASNGVDPYEYKLGAGTYQSSGTFANLAPGTYSITAKDAFGCTVTRSYTITDNGKDAYESNNAIGAAKNISLNTNIIARIGTATDQDWFKFNAGGNIDITVSHGSVNYNVQLFTNAGMSVTPVSQTGNTISYTGLEFAVYRIQITGAQSFVCYNLMVAPAPPVVTGAEMLTSKAVAPDELKAQAFPNPHNGSFILQVESPVAGKGSIVLYDLQGRAMVTREENLRAGTNQVRFSNLQPENYFYRVMVGGKSTAGKVFKQ